MKKIVSTTGEKISFLIRRGRQIIIEPIIAIEVTIEEFEFLVKRLGSQIKVQAEPISVETTQPTEPEVETETAQPTVQAPEEQIAPAAPTTEETAPAAPVAGDDTQTETAPMEAGDGSQV